MNISLKSFKSRLDIFAVQGKDFTSHIQRLLKEVGKLIPFEAACFTTVDPQTLLSTGAVADSRIEALHHAIFINEYGQEDFNKYRQLALSSRPVAALGLSTEGNLDQSSRYRDILDPAGFGDELRAAVVWDGTCQGYMTLLRLKDQPLFSGNDEGQLLSLLSAIAHYLRLLRQDFNSSPDRQTPVEPGILLFTEQLECTSTNSAADHWMARLREYEKIGQGVLPRPVRAVVTHALLDNDHGDSSPSAKTLIRLPENLALIIRASQLRQTSGIIQLAVWIEPASAPDMLQLLMETYGLSEREKQLIGQVIRGASTKELAQALHISAYTVQDHMKSIFAKAGVASRRELIWHLYSRFNTQQEA